MLTKQQLQPTASLSLTKLHGDASNRIYYRVSLPNGSTMILMKLPPGAQSVSEEITNLKAKPAELPFLNVQRFLLSRNLPVPLIHAFDPTRGLMLLEDIGDKTFEKDVVSASVEGQVQWYRKAIQLLVQFQAATALPSADCIAYQRSFDESLLDWEFEHFLEYGIEARFGTKISEDDRKKIHQGTRFITFALTQLPRILVHRDFQSRNLMIDPKDQSLRLLDFQDALMGPLPYDLVALLRDSYISLPWASVAELISYYIEERTRSTGKEVDKEFFFKTFDWMTIQRKLKDAGRFVYIDQVKNNPSFLTHIPNSLAYIRSAFERQPELQTLFEILKQYVPELR